MRSLPLPGEDIRNGLSEGKDSKGTPTFHCTIAVNRKAERGWAKTHEDLAINHRAFKSRSV